MAWVKVIPKKKERKISTNRKLIWTSELIKQDFTKFSRPHMKLLKGLSSQLNKDTNPWKIVLAGER